MYCILLHIDIPSRDNSGTPPTWLGRTRRDNAKSPAQGRADLVIGQIASWMAGRDRPGFSRDATFPFTQDGEATKRQFAFLGAIGTDEYLFRVTAASSRPDDVVLHEHFPLPCVNPKC